jgi:hypothetical protein
MITGSPDEIKTMCPRYAVLRPGMVKKERVANQIYKITGLSTDDLLGVLPGACEVVEESGIMSAPSPVSEEE